MNAKDFLFELYEQWRDLSEAEGDAIRRSDWQGLSNCQKTKLRLQESITHWTGRAWEQWAAERKNWAEAEAELREVIGQLILLEQRNGEWLGEKYRATKARQTELEQSTRNLRRVQGAYAYGSEPLWNSYS